MRRQKMWVRRDDSHFPGTGALWEAGCQVCGYVIYADWTWERAMRGARDHSFRHA